MKPVEVVSSDVMEFLLYGNKSPLKSRATVGQNKSPPPPVLSPSSSLESAASVAPVTPSASLAAVTTTPTGGAIGIIETESQSLSQSPWSNVALRKAAGDEGKFKSKPYVPPGNVSFLPPKVTTDEEKLALSRERSLSKMKTKKNDSWMKPKGEDTESATTTTSQQPPPSPTKQPQLFSPAPFVSAPSATPATVTATTAPVATVASPASSSALPPAASSAESRPAKYSTVAFDDSSSDEDSDKEVQDEDEQEMEEAIKPTEPETPMSKFTRLSLWLSDEDKLVDLENYFGVGSDRLKEDVNSILDSETQETLLHRACSHGVINVIQCLIEGAGSDVNALDSNGLTPLHYAIRSAHSLVAKYLIKQCGSDLTKEDFHHHLTPLALCRQLLSSSSESSVQGDGGSVAQEESWNEIQKVLEKYEKKSIEKRLKITQPHYQRETEEAGIGEAA
jgi:hypothetical protein